jgi:hypothetical protein
LDADPRQFWKARFGDLRAAKMDAIGKAIQMGLDGGPADDFDIDDIKQRGRQRLAAKATEKKR